MPPTRHIVNVGLVCHSGEALGDGGRGRFGSMLSLARGPFPDEGAWGQVFWREQASSSSRKSDSKRLLSHKYVWLGRWMSNTVLARNAEMGLWSNQRITSGLHGASSGPGSFSCPLVPFSSGRPGPAQGVHLLFRPRTSASLIYSER